jgi:hypothetical protein
MKERSAGGKKMKGQGAAAVRASISFPHDVYETLETM